MALGRIWGFLMTASVNHGKDGSRRASEQWILVAVEEDMLLWGIFRCNLHIKQVCHSLWNWLNWIGCSLDWHISKLTPRGVELGTRWWLKDKINCCVISHHVVMWELWVVGIANTSSLTSHLYTHYNWNQDLTLYKRVVQGLMKKTRKRRDENHSCLLACPQPYLLSAIPTLSHTYSQPYLLHPLRKYGKHCCRWWRVSAQLLLWPMALNPNASTWLSHLQTRLSSNTLPSMSNPLFSCSFPSPVFYSFLGWAPCLCESKPDKRENKTY